MSRLIKSLRQDRKVLFDFGTFDDWCVFVVEANGSKKAPLDVEYFRDLQNISERYPEYKVYRDFVRIYEPTNKLINPEVLHLIDEITNTYAIEDQQIIEQWFAVLYGGMIAEENKQFAILKKRIKRLGMHQTLVLKHPPEDAANFSRGKKWRELDELMKALGF